MASEMAKLVTWLDRLRERGDAIRADLRRQAAFAEVSRGRWRLGYPPSTAAAAVEPVASRARSTVIARTAAGSNK